LDILFFRDVDVIEEELGNTNSTASLLDFTYVLVGVNNVNLFGSAISTEGELPFLKPKH